MGEKVKRQVVIRRTKQGDVVRTEKEVPADTPRQTRMKVRKKEEGHSPVVHVGAHLRGTGTIVRDYSYDNMHSAQDEFDQQSDSEDWHKWQGWRGTRDDAPWGRVVHPPKRQTAYGADTYRNYAHLSSKEHEGRDFSIEYKRRNDNVAVVAIHGGNTEPGTTEAAKAIAGEEHNYYSMISHKPLDNNDLHITSTSFDEPKALKLVSNSLGVISIHGSKDVEKAIYIGGRNEEWKQKVQKTLEEHGFNVKVHDNPGLSGGGSTNIVNRGVLKGGVQLELSRGLREAFFEDGLSTRGVPTQEFHNFVKAIRSELKKSPQYMPKHIEHPKK